MAIKPLADRVLLETLEPETKTQGGLYIPDNAKEKPQKARVVAVGAGKKNDKGESIAAEVKVGDIVLYGKYSGTEVQADGKDYLIIKESDILAVL